MKKYLAVMLFILTAEISKAQQVNLAGETFTYADPKPGDEFYLGADFHLHSIQIGKEGQIRMVVNGKDTWVDMPKNIPVPAPLSLANQQEGYTAAFINGVWVAVPASYNIGPTNYKAQTTGFVLANVTVPFDGQYTVCGVIKPSVIAAGASITLSFGYTDTNNLPQSKAFPAMTTATASTYSPVQISCKAGTAITVQTVLIGTATYDISTNIHEIN